MYTLKNEKERNILISKSVFKRSIERIHLKMTDWRKVGVLLAAELKGENYPACNVEIKKLTRFKFSFGMLFCFEPSFFPATSFGPKGLTLFA